MHLFVKWHFRECGNDIHHKVSKMIQLDVEFRAK